MPRRSCLSNLIVAEELITGITDQGEPVNVVYLDFSKAFDSVYHRLLIKEVEAMEIHPMIKRWIDELQKNRTFRVILSDHHSSKRTVKNGVPQALCLDRFSS